MSLRARFPVDWPIAAVLALLLCSRAFADLSLADAPGPNDFILSDNGQPAAVFVEAAEDRAVQRAAADLAEDFQRVSGVKSLLIQNLAGQKPLVIAGTLGKSKTIDRLAAEGKLQTNGIAGQWESYVLQIVKNPGPGAGPVLVVAGSDRRGTIYGIYELSEMIGVSPWYWWADVPVKQRKSIVLKGDLKKQGPPAVKYRGIFLNDEDWGLRPWAATTFEPETGNIGPKTYAKIFELLLRLRANYIWPAMHEGTPAFNSFPTNREIADAYGIVMGSSHCEQMLRDNVDEWQREGQGEYNYVVNRDGVLKYWEQRVRENGKFENVFTVGMRGIHDGGMPGGGTEREKAERLHHIITDQRDLLARWVNTNVAQVPQIFCPYKEVLPLYRLAPNIPEDITLVWPDDNYGYIRQFSNQRERQRSGGAGVYYHLSYWGTPNDYLWLATTPPALIREEMTKAFDYGASNLWVVNVGDLKPCEVGMEFFLELAWNPHRWDAYNVDNFLEEMAARDFGKDQALPIATLLDTYYHLNFARKPEHVGVVPGQPPFTQALFSCSANGDENQLRIAYFKFLAALTEEVRKSLAPDAQDAFFELVGYPIRAAMLANEKALNLNRFYVYSAEGRASAGEFLEKARQAHDAIQTDTETYNRKIAGGKWRNMMSASPRNLPQFGFPNINLPKIPEGSSLAIQVEGTRLDTTNTGAATSFQLPEFNRFTRREYFIDVFNRGGTPVPWTATASAPWIKLDQARGTRDARIQVELDWEKVPVGEEVKGTVRVTAGGQTFPVEVKVYNPGGGDAGKGADFFEDNRCVAMEAEHATTKIPGKSAKWERARGLGYNGEAMTVTPNTAAPRTTPDQIRSESPCLKYSVWIRTPGEWKVTVRALPTFSVESGKPQRCAIAWDDAPPKIVSFPVSTGERDRQWQENVLRNAALAVSTHPIGGAGLHTLNVWMVDPGIVIDTIVADRGSLIESGYAGPAETMSPR